MKITFLTPDMSGNGLGRALLLAEVLAPLHDVKVAGVQIGEDLWAPAENCSIPLEVFPAGKRSLREKVSAVRDLFDSIDADVVYATKPMFTSFGVALAKRALKGPPVVLDIDDDEVSFATHLVTSHRGRILDLANPDGYFWRKRILDCVGRASEVTVVSSGLQKRYGGQIVMHAKDTDVLHPAAYDLGEAKAMMGIERETPVVMFLGTPRAWKGLDDLTDAMDTVPEPAKLIIAGVGNGYRGAGWDHPRTRLLPQFPLRQLPAVLSAADVVVIPQRQAPQTARQLPSKLLDAMALGKPIVATRVADIPEILANGRGLVVEPSNPTELSRAITHLLDDPNAAREMGSRARQWCVEHASHDSTRDVLNGVVNRALQNG